MKDYLTLALVMSLVSVTYAANELRIQRNSLITALEESIATSQLCSDALERANDALTMCRDIVEGFVEVKQ